MEEDNNSNITSNAHGGRLILSQSAILDDIQIRRLERHKISISRRVLSDLELIANGGLSPLNGFMDERDYKNVLKNMHLENGTLFPFPITLPLDNKIKPDDASGELGLSFNDKIVGYVDVEAVFDRDVRREAKIVYQTDDEKHPGVAMTLNENQTVISGKAYADLSLFPNNFKEYSLTPYQTREIFYNRRWKSIVGFQTRNPIHRAHEHLIKCALEIVDGAFIHPLIGGTKADDIPADVRMRCYEVLLKEYFPKDKVVLGVFPATMRYAGPKEAIFHAIVRKNYGCTHFIIGRDHAGVGKYYGPFDAQKIFDKIRPGELDINILKFDDIFYCKKCESMASIKTCPHNPEDHISLSGTRMREMLSRGIVPDKVITRPEVAQILIESMMNKKS